MINIVRSKDEPVELTHQRALPSGSYNTEPIRRAVAETFMHKCYLCEHDKTNFNIEHLKSHRIKADLNLYFDWQNLFYCCRNCNSIKSVSYDDILDCCNTDLIITDEIKYELDNADIEQIKVKISSENRSVAFLKTIELLNSCFAGTTYDTRNVAFETKKELFREMNTLKLLIIEYLQYLQTGDQNRAKIKKLEIERELDKSKPFIAFKITFIKNNSRFMQEFASMLPSFV